MSMMEVPNQFGSHKGFFSGRVFFLNEIGLPIRSLTTARIKFTLNGVAVVEQHLVRFELVPENARMLRRLKAIVAGELEFTQTDLNFYAHELREYVRYRNLGYKTGEPVDDVQAFQFWNNLHTATLEDYQLREGEGVLYHNSV